MNHERAAMQNWQMPGGVGTDAMRRAFAGAFSVRAHRTSVSHYRFLDSHEWALWFNGSLVYEQEGCLHFCSRENGWIGAERGCTETRTSSPRFWWDIDDAEMVRLLRPLLGVRCLLPVAEITCRERLVELLDADEKTVCRFQLTNLFELPRNRKPFFRVCRLVPLRGYDREAEESSRILRSIGACDIADGPLTVALARQGRSPQPYSLRPAFGLTPELPVRQAVRMIVRRLLEMARECEAGIIGDLDTEFLHDYRICLRKIRSALGLVKDAYPAARTRQLRASFAKLSKATNRLRDVDVHLLSEDSQTLLLPEVLRPALGHVFDDFRNHRKGEFGKVARRLKSGAYGRRVDSLAQFFTDSDRLPGSSASQSPIGPLVARQVRRRYRRIRKCSKELGPDASDSAFHELRIHCKKLRYLLEFFSELLPPDESQQILRSLRRCQNRLGELNDCAVQQRSLMDYWETEGRQRANCETLGLSVGGVVAVLHGKELEQRARAVSALLAFGAKDVRSLVKSVFEPLGAGAG